jgi:hypothetical protein
VLPTDSRNKVKAPLWATVTCAFRAAAHCRHVEVVCTNRQEQIRGWGVICAECQRFGTMLKETDPLYSEKDALASIGGIGDRITFMRCAYRHFRPYFEKTNSPPSSATA